MGSPQSAQDATPPRSGAARGDPPLERLVAFEKKVRHGRKCFNPSGSAMAGLLAD
jgi:hypothetical protein